MFKTDGHASFFELGGYAWNEVKIVNKHPNAADQIKNVLIDEYLKKNPSIKRNEIVVVYKNGKVIFDKISSKYCEVAKRKGLQESLHEKQLLETLKSSGNERFKACARSIENSRCMIEWMYRSNDPGMTLEDRNGHFKYLEGNERQCADASMNLETAKKEFFQLIEEGKLQYSKSKTIVTFYLQAVNDQLNCLYRTFKKEIELGNQYVECTKRLIESALPDLEMNLKSSQFQLIRQTYQSMLRMNMLNLPPANELTAKQMSELIQKFEQYLHGRRSQIQSIQNVVKVVDCVIEQIALMDKVGSNQIAEVKTMPHFSDASKTKRMAYPANQFKGRLKGRVLQAV